MLRGADLPARRCPAVELTPVLGAAWGRKCQKISDTHGFRYRERGAWALPVELSPLDDLPALVLPVGCVCRVVCSMLCIMLCVCVLCTLFCVYGYKYPHTALHNPHALLCMLIKYCVMLLMCYAVLNVYCI